MAHPTHVVQEGIEEALEVAERMLKEQRERPTPVGFRFTIDEEAHAELLTEQTERVTNLLTPHTYTIQPGQLDVEFDEEELRPAQSEPRARDLWMNDRLSGSNYAADVINAARARDTSAIKITERAAGFDWLSESTVLDSVVQTQLALVGEAMSNEPDFATEDAHGDLSAEDLVRQQQDGAEKSAAAMLAALDKLQPNTVPLEELVEAFEREVEADALLATQNCDMLAPGYLDQLDLEIAVQVTQLRAGVPYSDLIRAATMHSPAA